MYKRTTAAYTAVFDFMNAKIFDMSGTKTFYTDFVLAMRNALKKKYPASKLSSFILLLKANLPLLPPRAIAAMFDTIKNEAKELGNASFDRFISYYYRQWMEKEGPQKISVFDDEIRTQRLLPKKREFHLFLCDYS